jgi:hypothetical protein
MIKNYILNLVVFFLFLPLDDYCQNSTGFDVSTAVYNQSYYIRSSANGYVLTPNSIKFNNDGSKMFILDAFGNNSGKIKEYHLSTAFDISSSNYITDFDVSSQDNNPTSMAFNNDGTKIFMTGRQNSHVNEYNLSTAFNIQTASFTGISERFDLQSQEDDPTALTFNNNGTKMYVLGYDDEIYQYSLSTAFDVSTASFLGNNNVLDIYQQESRPNALVFNNNGTKMFVMGADDDDINEYHLSSPYDVMTATYTGAAENFSVYNEDRIPTSLAFNNDGTKMYVLGELND